MKLDFHYPAKVPTSNIRLALMDVAKSIKNFPCAVLTAMLSIPWASLFANAASNASSFLMRKELWYLSDLVQFSKGVKVEVDIVVVKNDQQGILSQSDYRVIIRSWFSDNCLSSLDYLGSLLRSCCCCQETRFYLSSK